MEFGKLADISRVKFHLPANQPGNSRVLKQSEKTSKPTIYVGCPIWVNKNWVGSTYPTGTKDKDFLKQYAIQFNTIELNSTHYHIPDHKTIEKWKQNTPEYFRFSPKFPQEISHRLLPAGNARELTFIFSEMMQRLEDRLGTCFIQLPPQFGVAEIEKLDKFLSELPRDLELAVELRNRSWFFPNNLEEVSTLLENYQIGTVITDVAGRRDVLHMRLTNPKAMIRFVGNDLHPTDYQRVDEWISRIKSWIELGLEELYFFVHQPDNDKSPELARYFIHHLNKECNLELPPPKIYTQAIQQKLFE